MSFELATRGMTPVEREKWWRRKAAEDYDNKFDNKLSWRNRQECRMSVKAIMDYVSPMPRRRRNRDSAYPEAVDQWYKQGGFVS